MNVTFFIGNGFDINLGLKTSYTDFVKEYKKSAPRNANLKKFREYISENEELWSSAEIALGLYTKQFSKGEGAIFSECQADICMELIKYLKRQQRKVDSKFNAEVIGKVFYRMNKITDPFPAQERGVMNDVYSAHKHEPICFHFICFNYTETLDKCIELAEDNPNVLGTHRNGSQIVKNSIGALCHVHGTVNKDMVFGVNDDTQIAKIDIFECDNGDIYKNLLIKRNANASYRENTDAIAAGILSDSHIIYIYGMSIGSTDKVWWERICRWLYGDNDRHLIIHNYGLPVKGAFPVNYQLEERKCQQQITQYGNYDNITRSRIESRIHVTNNNIFADLKNIVTPLEASFPEALTQIQIEKQPTKFHVTV